MAKKETKRDKLIRELKDLGWSETKTRSSKYVALSHPDEEDLFFIGRKGALRKGSCATKSISMRPEITIELLRRRLKNEF